MKRLMFVLGGLLLLAACGPVAAPIGTGGQLVKAQAPRHEAEDLSGEQVKELVQGNSTFALDFYQIMTRASGNNLIYSPYSISLAFSMVYAGARGETQAQMQEAFNYLLQDIQHMAFNALDQHLSDLGKGVLSNQDGREPFQLNITNAVWGQEGSSFKETYLNTLAQNYGAGLRLTNFTKNPEASRSLINQPVAEQTRKRIENFLPQDFIDSSTRLVLTNAIYFRAAWQFQFDPSATEDGTFTLLDESNVTIPLMHLQTARVPYTQGDGYQAALLPYAGGVVDMLVVLPEVGRFESIEQRLSSDFLEGLQDQVTLHDVTLSMPKFDFESEIDLSKRLKEMGMTEAFGPQADFSGMVDGGGLFISAALHKATIALDEKGTEAAAATAVAMAESAMEQAEMTIDRPFILAIIERDTGSILFLGRVMNPAE